MGFEPTRIAPPELESGALDRSAKLSSVTVVCTVLVEQCVIITQKNNKSNTPGRTRTCNLWIRSPTRYPLRHEGLPGTKFRVPVRQKIQCSAKQYRHRGDSNPCGQSPSDFESDSLTTRTQCHLGSTASPPKIKT